MSTSRRTFLRTSALAGGALGLGLVPSAASAFAREGELDAEHTAAAPDKAKRALRMLILGGTGFTGPAQVEYAVARGHTVTVFNRGRTNPGVLKAMKVEELTGDRNGDLSALRGRQWDVVIDNPTMLPRWVRTVGEILKDNTQHYIFISTISVYADTSRRGMDETTALLQLRDPASENPQDYGALKAASEAEAERQFPGKTTVIRPGLIVGPGDNSDRFTYWPVRIDQGGEVLAPGDGTDPVQIIDARDIAEWTIRMAEQRAFGIYNATGPAAELSMAEMLHGIRAVTSAPVKFTWVDAAFLASQSVRGWSNMPVWVAPRPESAGFSAVSIARALEKGLTFRPLAVTAKDTLDWHKQRPEAARTRQQTHANAPGLRPDREQAVLAAWKAKPST